MLVFAAAQWIPRARDILTPALFAPFLLLYLAVALRFVWLRVFHGEIEGYFDYTFPDPRVLLHFEFLVGAAIVYSALILVVAIFNSRARALVTAAVVGVVGIMVWAGVEYVTSRTFGATASDPFAYAQMGIDWATRGMAAHHFVLFPLVLAQQISWYPVLHVGYHLPFNAAGDAITVWSPFGSLAYALAYRLLGENGLYLVNPIFSWLCAPVAGLLAFELTRHETQLVRRVTAAGVGCVIATSNEIVNWAGVTMVDAQALLFTTLAIYCAVRLYRSGGWGWIAGTGIFWGLAYLVRHTQLVIALGFVPLYCSAPLSRRVRIGGLMLTCAIALVIALPDLWYHQTYLGSWLTPESEELALYAVTAVAQAIGTIAQSAMTGAEYGWFLPFIAFGIFSFTRRHSVLSSALFLWLAAELIVHLPYAALRLRDLLPEFPILAFYAVYGMATSVQMLYGFRGALARAVAAVLVLMILELSLVRVWNTLPRVAQEPRAQFGAMTRLQRASFDALAELTPQNALIGASLNSGAVENHAHRHAFRPADWCAPGKCGELRVFLALAIAKHYPIYLVEDNPSLIPVLQELRETFYVERVTTLDVPLFTTEPFDDAGALWRVIP